MVVEARGWYCGDDDDDDGFMAGGPRGVVVVSVDGGGGAPASSLAIKPDPGGFSVDAEKQDPRGCCCCSCCGEHAGGGSEAPSGSAGWWRPTMLLLLVVLLLVVFVLISGILLYYNYFIYDSAPAATEDPCAAAKCWWGSECELVGGRALCRCPPPEACAVDDRPVCGSDGATYASECQLRAEACRRKDGGPRIAAYGPCDPCWSSPCGPGEVCELDATSRAPTCRCREEPCPAEPAPVCASDGKTYTNECVLSAEACRTQLLIRLLHHGACSPDACEGHECSNYGVCRSDEFNKPHCQCPDSCADTTSPVCGSDGVTYKNNCELQKFSCQQQQTITVLSQQPCEECEEAGCQPAERCPELCPEEEGDWVCGSDGQQYRTLCHLQRAACLAGDPQLTAVSSCDQPTTTDPASPALAEDWVNPEATCESTQCEFEATCVQVAGSPPHCVCLFDCASVTQRIPVCASDMRTYPSECAMKMEGCQQRQELRLRPMELCQGMKVKPCNGQRPLVNAATGRDYDCGSGPNRQDCPPGSYCHQTANFARCCSKPNAVVKLSDCETSKHGCCPDGKTSASGPNYEDCPSYCGCNRLGALSDSCDPLTKQCFCKPGVGGMKCDRCESGYWGLPKISEGHQGCSPCDCSEYGSVREDCEQMTGRCMCKPGVQGQKCTICTGLNMVLGPSGCTEDDDLQIN